MSGMKQMVNQGHLVMQRADQLPQFLHCAVMFSAPLSCLVNSATVSNGQRVSEFDMPCVPNVRQNAMMLIDCYAPDWLSVLR